MFGFAILIAHRVPKACVLKGVFVVLILGQLGCSFVLCSWDHWLMPSSDSQLFFTSVSDTLPTADVGSMKEAPGVLVSCLSHTLPLICFSLALGSDLLLWGNFYDPVSSGLIPLTYRLHHSFLYSWVFGDNPPLRTLIFPSWRQDETLETTFPPVSGFQLPCHLQHMGPSLRSCQTCYLPSVLWLTFFLFCILFSVFCSVM